LAAFFEAQLRDVPVGDRDPKNLLSICFRVFTEMVVTTETKTAIGLSFRHQGQ
jgi:hypothetical protein